MITSTKRKRDNNIEINIDIEEPRADKVQKASQIDNSIFDVPTEFWSLASKKIREDFSKQNIDSH